MASTRKIFKCIIFCLGFCLLQTVVQHGSQQPAFGVATRGRSTPSSVKPPGQLDCLTSGNVPKVWRTPPKEITIQIRDSASASEILEVLRRERDNEDLDLIAIAAAWIGIARLQNTVVPEVENDPMMDEFVNMTLRLLKRCLFQELAPHAWACGNLFLAAGKLAEQGLFPEHLNRVQKELTEAVVATSYFMNEQAVANVIWACSKWKLPHEVLKTVMSSITYQLVDVAGDLTCQGASNILLAAGKLGNASPELQQQMPLMVEVLPELIPQMYPQAVANCLWAVGKLQHLMPESQAKDLTNLLPLFAKRIQKIIPNMIGQQVSSTLLVIGQVRSAALHLLVPALAKRMLSLLKVGSMREISNSCWGLALCEHADAAFMEAVTVETMGRGKRLNRKEVDFNLPQILAALARLDLRGHHKFLSFAAEKLEPMLKRINNWGLCAVAWSYSQLDVKDEFSNFRRAVDRQVASRGFSQEEVERSRLGPDEWYSQIRAGRSSKALHRR